MFETFILVLFVILFIYYLKKRLRKNPRKKLEQESIYQAAKKQKKPKTLDLHFAYLEDIRFHYRQRNKDPKALAKAIEACENQISIAPKARQSFLREFPKHPLPSHTGYEQLAIIRDKQGEWDEAIRLCDEAKSQGWEGDWDYRIDRYQKKLERRSKKG